jgi:cytoskeletal protein CcmA (bactofilin family)
MAAIFQIRRGTSNISLTEGELYLHQGSGSLQFGSGSSQYSTLTLNAPVKGDINLIGNISASGDVRIGGNIYLGDSAASDNISALGVFTTNLVPNGTIDLGTTTAKWNNVYGNSIWGAISASNGVISGSAQFTGVLSSLNEFSASQLVKDGTLGLYTASVDAKFTTLQSLTSSNSNRLSRLEESTSSLNAFSSSQLTKDSTLALYTTSVDAKFTTIQSLTSSNSNRLSRLEESTASLNIFRASEIGRASCRERVS